MSAVSKKRVATAAYEHVEGIYGGCLEDPDVSDSKKIFGIPSATDGTTPQFMIRKKKPRNLRWIQHMRVPDEPHIQGRVMKSVTRLEESHKLRNSTMEPTEV
jgi:hypothetical protein